MQCTKSQHLEYFEVKEKASHIEQLMYTDVVMIIVLYYYFEVIIELEFIFHIHFASGLPWWPGVG